MALDAKVKWSPKELQFILGGGMNVYPKFQGNPNSCGDISPNNDQ